MVKSATAINSPVAARALKRLVLGLPDMISSANV
jgi:hypothetical protein